MKLRRSWAGLVVMGALLGIAPGCEVQGSRVAQGQLYLSGEARFDAYFRDVHALQVAAAGWADEKKRTRRPLIGVLALTPDAGDITIVQATHDRMVAYTHDGGGTKLQVTPDDARVMVLPGTKSDPTFFHALEETVRYELDRDRKVMALVPQIEQVSRNGRALEPHVDETFLHGTPGRATEVKGEMSASFDALVALGARVHHTARESEDFIADLQRGVTTTVEPPARHDAKPGNAVAAKPPAASKPGGPAAPKLVSAAKKPEDGATAATPPPPPPPAKPAKKPADTGEVFNP